MWRGLRGKGCVEGIEGKWLWGGDYGAGYERRGLWGDGSWKRTV